MKKLNKDIIKHFVNMLFKGFVVYMESILKAIRADIILTYSSCHPIYMKNEDILMAFWVHSYFVDTLNIQN